MCTGWEKPGGGWEELRERCCWVSNIAINYEKRSWKRILCPIKKHEWSEVELGRNPPIREENLSWKKFFTEKRREEREGARWRWSQGVVWKILEAHEITIILAIGGIVPRDPPWGLFKPRLSRARGHALKIIGPCYGGVHRGNIFRVGEPRFIEETRKVEIFFMGSTFLFFSFFLFYESFWGPRCSLGGEDLFAWMWTEIWTLWTSTLFTGIFEVFEMWCLSQESWV